MNIQEKLWQELCEGPRSCEELAERTNLSVDQVRYNIYRLKQKGWRISKEYYGGPYVMERMPGAVVPGSGFVNRESFLEVIRSGSNSLEDLAERFGVGPSSIPPIVRELRGEGFPIVNIREDGDHDPPIYRMMGVKRNPAGRRCAQDGCPTILSVYNDSDYCFTHDRENYE